MKKKIIFLFSIISSIIFLISITYAWPVTFQQLGVNVEGQSTDGYYAGGTGTMQDPYLIRSSRHLYNLAWLQDLGFYDDHQYYFKLDNDIDMTGIAIPPVGINGYGKDEVEHPFIGYFDGNGCTIKNLNISLTNLVYYPRVIGSLANFDFGNYIGLFGYIGKETISESLVIGDVRNFYLDGVNVNGISNEALIGLVGGYVKGSLSNVGIKFGQIALPTSATKLSVTANISNYAVVGDFDSETVSWTDKPGNEGTGYGGSFDVQRLTQRMSLIYTNQKSANPSSLLPVMETESTLSKGEIAPLTIANPVTSSYYEGADAAEVPSPQNVGYYCGNQNKITSKSLKYCDYNAVYENGKTTYSWESKKVPRTFFKRTGDNATTTSENIVAMTNEEIADLPDGIKSILDYPMNTNVTFDTIRLQQRFEGPVGNDGGKQSIKPQISYYGDTYNNVYLPNNGIWFRPKIAGKFRFVVFTERDGADFSLYKLKRSSASAIFNHESISTTTTENLHSYSMPYYALIYYEYDVTASEIEQGYEFLLGNDRGTGGAYFLYLDIGINGQSTSELTSGIDTVGFVYSYVLENETVYSDIDSTVLFGLNGTATKQAIVQFLKNETNGVVYYVTPDSGISVTKIGSGDSLESNEPLIS